MTKKTALIAIIVIAIVVVAGILLTANDDAEPPATETKIPVVGILGSNDESANLFIDPLTERGYIEGENIQYVTQTFITSAEYEPAVQALIDADVDVIISIGTPITLVASELTSTIPIVFISNQGQFITDLEPRIREQGAQTNLTGVITTNPTERRFELMMEIVPTIEVIYVPFDPSNPLSVESLALLEAVASERGVSITTHEYTDTAGAALALEEMPEDVDVILLATENPMLARIGDWMDLSMQRQVPLVASLGLYNSETITFPAVLMGYGGGIGELYSQAIDLVDQLLKGTAPADLPARPSDVYLTVSLGAADALGLEIPDAILDQANYVLREPVPPPATEEVTASSTEEATAPVVASEAACNATVVSAIGENSVCLDRGCDLVEDSAFATYNDKVEVASCASEALVGTCTRPIGITYFYSGEVALIEGGCAATGGVWQTAAE